MVPSNASPDGLVIADLAVSRAGRSILHGVSLEVPAGAITTLLGPNGAGKSTLMLTIAGLLPATRGRVAQGDRDLLGLRPEQIRSTGVAVVAEGRRLLGDLSVHDNLRVATYALAGDDAGAGLDRALQLFPELEKRWDTPARLLSGGEQQMVVIAQAIVSRPSTLLIDELSLGLAPVAVQRLLPALEAVAADGVGVLLVEQFAHVALSLAERAYVMHAGRIDFRGEASELRERPELLESAYRLSGTASAV
ncbi:Branched-chain amino acid transport ATP-binding protein LivF (TC 3.A.1.4.1) [Patulibacter medicamentivorans]|uniref:Branched-chain amino acid transport ATP-binding protein LivF (TC 3.A.1.4.1) n=1 Tax=Patulibacter medicamentivorans TaxID=1097667 RepID=H0E667_9ACTN|nr:ABC transporter ATP-binding protein [Patulibacter medicamentivorans]EHN10836.1 Branched-chain amino acid transport ATP-binding protein LivF (TC 3.A.1.4.1) [Patulibacter medicamentivorans]